MLSKSTCITIPTIGPHSEGPSMSQGSSNAKLVQSLDDASTYVMRTVETTCEGSRRSINGNSTAGVGTKILAESMKAQGPVHSPSSSSTTASSSLDKSVSEFISDWHN